MTFTWSPATVPAMGDTVTATVPASTTYIVTAADANGCTNTATVDVIVDPLSAAVATATSPAICLGDSSQLNVTVTGGGTPYNYTWTPTVGMQPGADTTANPKVGPGSTTAYTVVVTDACSNFAASIAIVTVNPNPIVLATASQIRSDMC